MTVQNFNSWSTISALTLTAGVLGSMFSWKTMKTTYFPPRETCRFFNQFPLTKKIEFLMFDIISPIQEELLFRGFIQDALLTKVLSQCFRVGGKDQWADSSVTKIARSIISSVAFAAAHLMPRFHLTPKENAFQLGLIASVVQETTGSMWPGLVLRAASNAITGSVASVYCSIQPESSTLELGKGVA